MGQLIKRLQDAAKSGVYRSSRIDPIVDALRGSTLSFVRIGLHGVSEKTALLGRIAEVLAFPDWFGANWDALEDCLTDLSWREAEGHILGFEDLQFLPPDDVGVLIDVLRAAAEFWTERGKPFFAVFIDPEHTLALPSLFDEA
jgi:hypothetical protein